MFEKLEIAEKLIRKGVKPCWELKWECYQKDCLHYSCPQSKGCPAAENLKLCPCMNCMELCNSEITPMLKSRNKISV
jgi:hypothetical protein